MSKEREVREFLVAKLDRDIPSYVWEAFWLKTSRGEDTALPDADKGLLSVMLQAHAMLAMIYKSWQADFCTGILFLSDFNGEGIFLRRLAAKAYAETMGNTTHYQKWCDRWVKVPEPLLVEAK